MKDKELDQILQHALTPTVSDEEIKVNYEMEGRPMMKKKNYFKPAVALVACAALVAGIGFGNLPEYGVPNFMTADGPAGLRIAPQCGVCTTAWPCSTMLACTWNRSLVEEVGAAAAKEVKENNISFWLAPS